MLSFSYVLESGASQKDTTVSKEKESASSELKTGMFSFWSKVVHSR